ncbi:MAG: DUF3108 domain-containing protein [Rubrivivax sp.]
MPTRAGQPVALAVMLAGALTAGVLAAPSARPSPPTDLPRYAARPPAPVTLEYELRRGLVSGSGRIDWRLAGGHYTLTMEGRALGVQLITWTSRGTIDAHGLVPATFSDKRIGRDEQLATFEREAGRIRYVGPKLRDGAERPLVPGTQDRLSWLLQIPAILEAQPALRQPGQRIDLYITGARANAAVWSFVVRGLEPVRLGDGVVRTALHLERAPPGVRDPRDAHDGTGDAWLDPARGYLPLRARLGSEGEQLELLLRP